MRLLGIGTALPAGSVDQATAAALSRGLVANDDRQGRLLEGLFRRSGVQQRHSVLVDAEAGTQDFYAPRAGVDDSGPDTEARMQRYELEAGSLAVRASQKGLDDAGVKASEVTHLVTVTCTGFHAPGPEITLIDDLGLSTDVARVAVGFMGCHGAFNGLRLADAIVRAEPAARVLVCAVELCSLHFSYQWDSPKLVANALFADGAAAFVCANDVVDDPRRDGSARLTLDRFASRLIPGSRGAMSWRIGSHGFEMTLSADLPGIIEKQLPEWLGPWMRDAADGAATTHWAVHPGGPRILDAVQRGMSLDGAALDRSRHILAQHGNMSSATVGFILDDLRRSASTGAGVALGFGPGLVAEAFEFRLDG